jgi:DNA-binding NarL/FixJ family response regulator
MRPLQVYLVEDQPLIREQLSATLAELSPASVVAWAEGQAEAEAWLAANCDTCDLLILDLSLRQGRGLPLIAAGRQALGADAVFDKSREIDALVHWCARQATAAPWRERSPRPRHWIKPFFKA